MEQQVFPTKGNLMLSKKALQLATLGYDLLDRKRNILIRELMKLVDKAQMLRSSIESTYSEATSLCSTPTSLSAWSHRLLRPSR